MLEPDDLVLDVLRQSPYTNKADATRQPILRVRNTLEKSLRDDVVKIDGRVQPIGQCHQFCIELSPSQMGDWLTAFSMVSRLVQALDINGTIAAIKAAFAGDPFAATVASDPDQRGIIVAATSHVSKRGMNPRHKDAEGNFEMRDRQAIQFAK